MDWYIGGAASYPPSAVKEGCGSSDVAGSSCTRLWHPYLIRVAVTMLGTELQHLCSGYNVYYFKGSITGTDLWMTCTRYKAQVPYRSHLTSWNLNFHYHAHRSLPLGSLLNQMNPVNILFNMIHISLNRSTVYSETQYHNLVMQFVILSCR